MPLSTAYSLLPLKIKLNDSIANETMLQSDANCLSEYCWPKISIITATFNAGLTLPNLIESLRAQSDHNFEWIVVDGGSTDSTIDLLRGCGDVVTSMISEPDFGIYHAINKGIRMSQADYYLVMGADDQLFPEAVANFRSHATRSRADIISAGISVNGKASHGHYGKSWLHGMFAYVSGHSVGTLIRRNLHDRFGDYSKRFPVAADMYFLKSVCQHPDTVIEHPSFIAGEHGIGGVSSIDKAATFCDCFRVQLETERWRLPQIIIFLAKLIWRMGDLVKTSRKNIERP